MRSHELRLDRALQHLQSLEAEDRRWREGNPYRIIHELDPQTSKKLVRVEVLSQPSVRLGLLIGDCLHNLRSALDNLAYELAVAYTGDPLPDAVATRSEFPILGDRPMKAGERQRKIGGIHPDAQTIIEGLQPCQRGQHYAVDPLWVLHELSNIDKHRLPLVTLWFTPTGIAFMPNSPTGVPVGISSIEWELGPIEHNAVIARYEPDPDYPDAEMQVHLEDIFGIAFG